MAAHEPYTIARHDSQQQPDGTTIRDHTFARNTTPHAQKGTWIFQRPDGPVKIFHNPSTGRTVELWAVFADGGAIADTMRLDREDGPAEIVIHQDGRREEIWHRNGSRRQPTAHERMKWEARKLAQGTPFHPETLHALAGGDPSMGAAGENWTKTTGGRRKKTAYHRDDGPAILRRDPETGRTTLTGWYRDGRPDRGNGAPYEEVFHANGLRLKATYATDGEFGRLGAPALIGWSATDGRVVEERWSYRGQLFRPNGPAIIKRDPATGEFRETEWFLNGSPQILPPKALRQAWDAHKARQGTPFTPGYDQPPPTQRTDGMKDAVAQTARAVSPKATDGEER